MELKLLSVVLFGCILPGVFSQFDCPIEWVQNNQKCYKFTFYPTLTFAMATGACQADGASLVSINDDDEHGFISNWLTTNVMDKNMKWYTSGMDIGGFYRWEGDGTPLPEVGHWLTDVENTKKATQTQIVYQFDPLKTNFVWGWSARFRSLPYICEISQAESYRINAAMRDFTYGTSEQDETKVDKGPQILAEPISVLILKNSPTISIECAAEGVPRVSYRWYKNYGTEKQVLVDQNTYDRYTVTNGRLTIARPDITKDVGDYQCVMENKYGSILSNPASIIKGFLNEFPNVAQAAAIGTEYQGTVLNCLPPSFNPQLNYGWYKDNITQFVRPRLNPHTFISLSGKLYFSELGMNDEGQYFCIIKLTTPSTQVMATHQSPGGVSLHIDLRVNAANANDYGPIIQDDFPAAYPSPPERGRNLTLECFAYGRLPMYYSWDREEYGLPANVTYDFSKRIMTIPNAKLEDSGNYTCYVKRGETAYAKKTIYVSVESKPYFMYPLKNQHLDKNSQVSWRCQAIAVPRATYSWFKNTEKIESIPGDIEVTGNILKIHSAEKRHEGMYQCLATNTHGSTYSSAQLRVLDFKPSFAKRPLKNKVATAGGNLTIVCSPEGAPHPTFTWRKDGATLSPDITGQGRVVLLANGNLVIHQLTESDAGRYTCEAENELGKDESSAVIYVTSDTTLVEEPVNTKVLVNNTGFLFCEASYDIAKHDLVYVWYFYDRQIDLEYEPHYTVGTRDGFHGLYIRYAQYKHQGMYKCLAETPQDSASASAFLTVFGPPGEPSGVYAKNVNNDRSIDIKWTAGLTHGKPILMYRIEIRNNFNLTWDIYKDNIHVEETVLVDGSGGKFGYSIIDLSPGTSYSFRVSAYNVHGYGFPSLPSAFYAVNDAPPINGVENVGGGGGSVGELRIQWDRLPDALHGGPNLYYKAYFRRKGSNNGNWLVSKPVPGDYEQFITILEHANYYREYEVKVQVLNDLGPGPNSSVVTIFSAPDMPLATPSNVNAAEINATAAWVYWDPVPDDREHMKGRVRGYQINYWLEGDSYLDARFIRHSGQADKGKIIGLTPNSDYWVNAQVFNLAGLGPKSEDYRVSTWANAPFLYPEFVNVTSRDSESVDVWWRGISTTMDEEALKGYKLWYWEASADMENRQVVEVGKVTHAVIKNLLRNKVYKLRVMGFNYGGDGKKSPTVHFTLGGSVPIDVTTTEILAKGATVYLSLPLLIICIAFRLML